MIGGVHIMIMVLHGIWTYIYHQKHQLCVSKYIVRRTWHQYGISYEENRGAFHAENPWGFLVGWWADGGFTSTGRTLTFVLKWAKLGLDVWSMVGLWSAWCVESHVYLYVYKMISSHATNRCIYCINLYVYIYIILYLGISTIFMVHIHQEKNVIFPWLSKSLLGRVGCIERNGVFQVLSS